MKIEHIALWSKDIERLSDFYVRYFDGVKGDKYTNLKKRFSSYFISFDTGCRLEIMHNDAIPLSAVDPLIQATGITHFAFDLETEENVMRKTNLLIDDGYQLVDGPRRTGDGYFESVMLDPDGNRIELASVATTLPFQ
ncbi:MAG: VOC family protein [Cyclobacteriaceae bacterium]